MNPAEFAFLMDGCADPADMARRTFEAAEAALAEHAQVNSARMSRIECAAGCNYCCYLSVRATSAEVALLADFLRANVSKLALAHIRKACQRIARLSPQQRLATRTACPLLKGGRCSVYPVRPLACRAWNSASAEACGRMFKTANVREPVPVYGPQKQLYDRFYQVLERHLATRSGGAPVAGELCAGLAQALD